MIPTPRVLSKVVDGLDALDLDNKDIMGDVYEYLLAKIASSGKTDNLEHRATLLK